MKWQRAGMTNEFASRNPTNRAAIVQTVRKAMSSNEIIRGPVDEDQIQMTVCCGAMKAARRSDCSPVFSGTAGF
jgi:hypothetical protein